MNKLQHVGLLGGTFNPPHGAHIALAQAARVQLGLARVELLPAGQPWQKAGAKDIASAAHRLAMCGLAVAGEAGMGVEPCEVLRSGSTFTVETLRGLRAANPQIAYTFIIGADQAVKFDTWRDWQGVLSLCRLAVAARAGQAAQLPLAVQAWIAAQGAGQGVGFAAPVSVEFPASSVSASGIRAALARGEGVVNAVCPAVARYIAKHSLYAAS